MPETYTSAKVDAQQQLDRLIRMYSAANQMTLSACAKRMGMCEGTIYRRMKHPGEFSLSELRVLRTVLGIPLEEMLEALQHRL